MNKKITLFIFMLLFSIAIISRCQAQPLKEKFKKEFAKSDSAFRKIDLEPSERLTVEDWEKYQQNLLILQREVQIRQDEHNAWISRIIRASKITFDEAKDSLQFTSTTLFIYPRKPKKK